MPPITILELFSYWLALLDQPSRYFLYVLSKFVTSPIHKEKLIQLSEKSTEGRSEYHRYCIKERRTIIEVLLDFYPVIESGP